MKRLLFIQLVLISWLANRAPAGLAAEATNPVEVRVEKTERGYRLLRDGKPFLIRGAGGDGSRELLVAAGGNSLRTWGADRLDATLDECQRLGLTVAVGIWLGHERHGFDYNNADQVAEQFQRARQVIMRYKDHPAVLLWGIGNEMEGYGEADNAAIWSAVNSIAAMARRLDPSHPTMTVVAEIGGQRVKNVHRLCPEIDIIGINSYGGAASLAQRYRQAGGEKPYIVTEFGPPGVWELAKNEWGVVPEPTSTEKAEFYRRTYQQAVLDSGGLCLGSYAFAWGHKQEATATWFGLLLPDGSRLAAVDTLTELWTSKPPKNRCPVMDALKLIGPDQVEPGATVRATLDVSDPEGDPLSVDWVLQREADVLGVGGDAEAVPPVFPEAIVKSDEKQADVRLPQDGGGYRLFAYVRDHHGGAAVGNLPLRVKGPVPVPQAKRATLPLVVYDEGEREGTDYVAAGWMGEIKAVKMDANCTEQPHAGETCLRVDYKSTAGWAGVVWQNPAQDWGDKPGGRDLTGARRLTFWARGAKGGKVVSFEFGLLGRDKRFFDTAQGKLDKLKLTSQWMQYSIDLDGKDLTRIKTGFCWVVAAEGQPVTFYLDDVRFE